MEKDEEDKALFNTIYSYKSEEYMSGLTGEFWKFTDQTRACKMQTK